MSASKPEPGVAELRAELEALRADLAKVRSDLAALPAAGRDAAADGVRAARDALEVETRKLMERLRGAAEEAKARSGPAARGAAGEIAGAIAKRPLTAMGVALGLGVMLGWMTNRKR